MFNIDEELILKVGASSGAIYKRGQQYYREGRVKRIKYDVVNNQFVGIVLGNEQYKVSIEFDDDHNYIDAQCTCPAYGGYMKGCKHIIAMLFNIRNSHKQAPKTEKPIAKQHYGATEDLLNHYNFIEKNTPITMEVDCLLVPNSHDGIGNSKGITNFSFRIGDSRLYIVKNIKELMEALETKKSIVFGKNFIFDANKHHFRKEDLPIINFLKELYEYEKMVAQDLYLTNDSLFKGKNITLPPTGVKRILNILKGRSINVEIDGLKYESIPITEETLLLEIQLEKNAEDLQLTIKEEDLFFPILPDGEYFFAKNKIINVPEHEQLALSPIIKSLYQRNNKIIVIPQHLQQAFFTKVFPRILKTEKINLSKECQSMIENVKLITKIYLDTEGKNVIAKILFNYGSIIINPFEKEEPIQSHGKIVIREVEQEESILHYFEEMEFRVKNAAIYLEDQGQIYDLIVNKIGELKEIAEVYYSESFKKIKIHEAISMTGRIRLAEDDLLEFSFEIEEISSKEIADVLKALKEKKKYYRLKDGTILQLQMKELNQLRDIISQLSLGDKDFEEGSIRLPKYRGMILEELVEQNEFITKDETFESFTNRIKNPESCKFIIPKKIQQIMRNYQINGFYWIKTLATLGLGGILADDMGLGKTLQIISAILSDKEEGNRTPSLVVVPSSLLRNWYEEVEKFAPELNTLVIYGIPSERESMIGKILGYDLIITSYPLIQKDVEKYKKITFNYYILDEAQHIKNPTSKNAKAVKEIKSKSRFALTGTPIENSLAELWSIFDFILPKYLGSYHHFRQEFEGPIIKTQDPGAYDHLTKHVKSFILRRMKTDVLQELPPKIIQTLYSDLTREQKKVYLATLEKIRGEIEIELRIGGFQKSHIKILAGLTRLRQICCHPALFIDNYEGDSGKLILLLDIIRDRIAEGHRILLFSQFTGMLKMISNHLQEENILYQYLDGSTDVKERGGIINEFNEGKGQVFLISLKAGGTGLNLTSADMVIHYDPWWNPAVEEQATDRAHRIGQDKIVHVMKLITKGTIEEKIIALQEKKRMLIDTVLQPGENLISKMTEAEIREIFEISS